MHSLFATLSGMSLSLGIFWRIFISTSNREKLAHSISLVTVVGLSELFGLVENGMLDIGIGIVQRLLYLAGFTWLIYQGGSLGISDAHLTALPVARTSE